MESKEELPGPVILDVAPISCSLEIARTRDPATSLPSSLTMRLRLLDDEVRTPDDRKLTNVLWTLTLYENGSGNEFTRLHNAAGMINYYEEWHSKHDDIDDSPEACHAWANVDSETFALLRDMALAGRLPSSFRLHASGMNYGWEPDGSARVWDVKAHKNAPINKLEIVASLVKLPVTEHDESEEFAVAPSTPESPELQALLAATKSIQQVNSRLGWVVVLVALMAAAVIFR
ncbi:hypothetical protein [Thermomonas paludicola]|uniref:hypothetical protein n=1 Tax=Thermomonas paludicola TaxID=2884874 RepID=UPI0021142CA6|nr:hypothetical protein [Thermomonas paludicola]